MQVETKNPLFLEKIDKFDISVFPEISFQSVFCEGLEVFNVSDVDISRGPRMNRERKCRRQWARILSPTNLQPSVIKRKTLE